MGKAETPLGNTIAVVGILLDEQPGAAVPERFGKKPRCGIRIVADPGAKRPPEQQGQE